MTKFGTPRIIIKNGYEKLHFYAFLTNKFCNPKITITN